jgi:hypothetical protein
MGNYEVDPVPPALLDALKRLAKAIDAYLKRQLAILAHRDVPGDATVCPGKNLYPLVVTMRRAAPSAAGLPAEEPATDLATLKQKCRWWCEESTRRLEAGDTARALAILHSLTRPDGGLMYRMERAK